MVNRLGAVLAMAGWLTLIAQAGVSDDEWKEALAKYKKLWAAREQVQAVEAIALDDVRAAQELWTVLTRHRPPSDTRDAIRKALARMTDEKAIEFLCSNATKKMEPEQRLVVCQALAEIRNEKVTDAMIALCSDKDPLVQTAACDALGVIGDKRATSAIVKVLDAESWQARSAAVLACVRLMDKSAIEPLIARLEKERGRVEGDIIKALKAMTGEQKEGAYEWKGWWQSQGSKGELGGGGISDWRDFSKTGVQSPTAGESKGDGSVATYYGIKIYSQRLIFVIDMSLSMDSKWEGKKPAVPQQTVEITGGESSKGSKPRKATLDWTKVKTKWDLAREHLIFTLLQLPEDTEFSIIFYSDVIKVWKPTLVKATPTNVAAAIAELRKTKPNSSTNIHGALKKAFEVGDPDCDNPKSEKPLEVTGGGAYKAGGDTIFFLTDGWPTDGKVIWKRPGAPDSSINPNWLEQMMDEVKRWNSLRRLKIHCIGIGNHCRELMRAVAEEFGGDYVIPGEDEGDSD
jgi:hypothetical protein